MAEETARELTQEEEIVLDKVKKFYEGMTETWLKNLIIEAVTGSNKFIDEYTKERLNLSKQLFNISIMITDMNSLLKSLEEYNMASDFDKRILVSDIFQNFFSIVWDATSFIPLENVVSLYFSVMFSMAKCALNAGVTMLQVKNIQIKEAMELYEMAHSGDYNALNEKLGNTIDKMSEPATFLNINRSDFWRLQSFIKDCLSNDANRSVLNVYDISDSFLEELGALSNSYNEQYNKFMNMFNDLLNSVREDGNISQENYNSLLEMSQKLDKDLNLGGVQILNSGYSSDKCAEEANRAQSDPLIVDMDNDGFEMTDTENDAYFDLNCDGFAEKVA